MCLAIPMKLVERREFDGTADSNGVALGVSLMLVPEAKLGDYVLVHAGYAISTVDEEEALRTIALIEEVMGGGVGDEV